MLRDYLKSFEKEHTKNKAIEEYHEACGKDLAYYEKYVKPIGKATITSSKRTFSEAELATYEQKQLKSLE